jgi:hypothetical protein
MWQGSRDCVTAEVIRGVKMKVAIFWDMTPCILADKSYVSE